LSATIYNNMLDILKTIAVIVNTVIGVLTFVKNEEEDKDEEER